MNVNKTGQIWNPYLPEYEYIPDGEPHVFGDRVYVYGSHDRFDGKKFCMNDYVCYSADVEDLTNWRYEGVIYKRTQDPRMADGTHELWAPDVVQGKDGRFYLYYCPDYTIKSIGVAVCDTPAGQYAFLGIVSDKEGRHIGEREGDTIQFDPGVFIDDDGSIYLYSGNGDRCAADIGKENKASVVMTLEDDMVTIKTEPKKLLPLLAESEGTGFEGHEFFEASSIRKVNGKYYLVYSPCCLHELCYAVSDRPDGDFRFGGVLVSNCDLFPDSNRNRRRNCFGNNHGGIECINGEWYIFYHRPTNRTMYSRQGCAERIMITEDGSIAQVEMTSQGLNPTPLRGIGTYPASMVCNLYGKTEPPVSCPADMGDIHPYLTQDGEDFDAEGLTGNSVGVSEGGKTTGKDTDGTDGDTDPPRQYIANCSDGVTAVFKYFEMEEAVAQLSVKVRGTACGKLLVRTEEVGAALGEIVIQPTQEWNTYTGSVNISKGKNALYLQYEGTGKLDLLEFTLG